MDGNSGLQQQSAEVVRDGKPCTARPCLPREVLFLSSQEGAIGADRVLPYVATRCCLHPSLGGTAHHSSGPLWCPRPGELPGI